MIITFKPLHESHFSLLLKWLESPHVKKWWDQDVTYTMDLVKEKYSSYVKGYKLEGGAQKPIQAFIIYSDQNPVGYIQIYNAYDFPRSKPLLGLPSNLGAFDIFIGEEEVLKQGLGSKAIVQFLKLHGNQYSYIFADPDINNLSAIKCYEKASFKRVSEQQDIGEVWMVKDLPVRNEPLPTIQKLIRERMCQVSLSSDPLFFRSRECLLALAWQERKAPKKRIIPLFILMRLLLTILCLFHRKC